MVGVFQNRQTAENLAGFEHLAPHGTNHVFEPLLVGVGVIALGAGKLAQADGHHFIEAAFDLAREIGVPLHASHQEHAIAIERVFVQERLDAIIG